MGLAYLGDNLPIFHLDHFSLPVRKEVTVSSGHPFYRTFSPQIYLFFPFLPSPSGHESGYYLAVCVYALAYLDGGSEGTGKRGWSVANGGFLKCQKVVSSLSMLTKGLSGN
ncbi:hypothetical protein TNCT_505531 [Trichonephila clavata]|uniref:Uncharacterized protein n=1 Tax=Trichonephila clavata TaxID=2740835 RepID=A0A8X6HFC3_TRICU|nr:hypothetical protein TNCT_505531 [Trichonephila clavata]